MCIYAQLISLTHALMETHITELSSVTLCGPSPSSSGVYVSFFICSFFRFFPLRQCLCFIGVLGAGFCVCVGCPGPSWILYAFNLTPLFIFKQDLAKTWKKKSAFITHLRFCIRPSLSRQSFHGGLLLKVWLQQPIMVCVVRGLCLVIDQ